MFVAINNSEMNVPQVLDWINRTKNANNNIISPEFAMDILSKTNFYGHIKTVLKNIKDRCKTKDEILPYKEFILSCVDRRVMSEQAMADLQKLAEKGGFGAEFDKVNGKTKIYELKDCENVDVKIIKTKKEFYNLGGENLRIFFDADKIDLSSCCLSNVKSLKFREGSEVNLSYAYGLPKDLDVSMCSEVNLISCDLMGISFKFREGAEVNLTSAYNFPKDLDLSMWSKVNLSNCYLDKVEKIKFREGAHINLDGAHYLPKDLDLSMCSVVDLYECDLAVVEKIKFREGAKISLQWVHNSPKNLDVSMCSEVDLSHNDLEKLKLKFREGAIVNLSCAYTLPKELDLSMCSKVNLINCDLEGVERIKFGEGALVNLSCADNLPKDLDLSMCSKVNLSECYLSGVERIKFRDKAQKREFMDGARGFTGKVEYVGYKGVNMVNGNGGKDM